MWGHAMDNIIGFSFDEQGMAARVNAVQDGVAGPVIAALDSSDNTIRCKAANALGSLATARPAADLLLGSHDAPKAIALLQSMVFEKSLWLQADAYFALGWLIDAMDDESSLTLGEAICDVLTTSFHTHVKKCKMQEKEETLRVYAAILLHKFVSRHTPLQARCIKAKLLPALHIVLTNERLRATLCPLGLRILQSLASSTDFSIKQSLLDARFLAIVAKFRACSEDLDLTLLGTSVCDLLVAHHKRAKAS